MLLRILDSYIILCLTFYGFVVGVKSKIYCNLLLWDICMLKSSCLLMGISIRRNEFHPAIFEFEGECRLWGSWKMDDWWTGMYVNICKFVLECPFGDISTWLFIGWRRFKYYSWYFNVEGVKKSHVIRFYFIRFHFICCFKFWFF